MNGKRKQRASRAFDLEVRLVNFAVRVLNLVKALPSTKAGNHVPGHLLGSGTSPAPNCGEAQSVESRKDFLHKIKIALKELRETLICDDRLTRVTGRYANNAHRLGPCGAVIVQRGF